LGFTKEALTEEYIPIIEARLNAVKEIQEKLL
jgi:hypothetical protein